MNATWEDLQWQTITRREAIAVAQRIYDCVGSAPQAFIAELEELMGAPIDRLRLRVERARVLDVTVT